MTEPGDLEPGDSERAKNAGREVTTVRLEHLRSLVSELLTGGMVITHSFAELAELADFAQARGLAKDQAAFRTFVQLDGDLCQSIHDAALSAPGFAAARDHHMTQVKTVLGEHTRALSRWVARVGQLSFGAGFILGYASGVQTEWTTKLGLEARVVAISGAQLGPVSRALLTQAAQLAGAAVLGVAIGALARWILRKLLSDF